MGWKGPGDRVTDVDIALESDLVTEIRRRFPDDGIVTEEGFATDPLFPPDAAAYRGAPMPFLAGNCVAHVEAVAACGGAIASVLEGLQ